MKKFVPLLIVGMVVLVGLEAGAVPFHMTKSDIFLGKQKQTSSLFNADVLDQQQPLMDWFGPIGPGPLWNHLNYIIAQTFTPTKSILTRVELMVGKNITTTYDYTVVIRDSLNGVDLTTIAVPAGQIMTDNMSWIEFDFPDITVIAGNTYYIVSSTVNVTDNWYGWGLKMGEAYVNGTIYYTVNDGANWSEEPGGDMTFKTYGKENIPPNEPLIEGETAGKIRVEYPYEFSTTDLDGDQVYYWIDWGDNTSGEDWIGPYASGEVVIVKHTYTKKGTYVIKAQAKDIYGAESAWGYLEVKMPCSYGISLPPFLKRLFERFPYAFPLLRHLMGY